MSIDTPVSTVLLVLVGLAALVTVALAAVALVTRYFVTNHKIRVARHEPMGAYYGRVLLGR